MAVITDYTKIYIGTTPVSNIYLGNEIMYPKITSNLKDGLISYYKLDGDTFDSKGENHLNNFDLSFPDGITNQGAKFDITDKKPLLDGIVDTNLAVTSYGFSASCWVKFDNAPQAKSEWIMSRNNNPINPSPSQRDFDMSRFGNRIYFDIYTLNESAYIETSYAVNDTLHPIDTWIHFVFTYNGNGRPDGMKIYENGEIRNNGFNASTIVHVPPVAGNLALGNQNFYPYFANSYSLEGNMDEVGFWNRELNQMEVNQLYGKVEFPFDNIEEE